MLKFIIVEDDVNTQRVIKDVVTGVMFKRSEEYDIVIFDRYDERLKSTIDNNRDYKIYIMDIELANEISGIQIAESIRENDWDSEIIFITCHDKMFESVYRTVLMVFDFIEKFHNMEQRLKKDLNMIVTKKHDTKSLYFENNRIGVQIKYQEILFIYRDTVERKIIVVTNDNNFIIKKTINNMINELDKRFELVHRACIVNTDHVTTYCWNKGYFVLDNGVQINMLSKKYKKKREKK